MQVSRVIVFRRLLNFSHCNTSGMNRISDSTKTGMRSNMTNAARMGLACYFIYALSAFAGDVSTTSTAATSTEENSRDLVSIEPTYTFNSDFKDSRFGDGSSVHNDFSYDHRFLISGKWYLRTGIEYERYDFD